MGFGNKTQKKMHWSKPTRAQKDANLARKQRSNLNKNIEGIKKAIDLGTSTVGQLKQRLKKVEAAAMAVTKLRENKELTEREIWKEGVMREVKTREENVRIKEMALEEVKIDDSSMIAADGKLDKIKWVMRHQQQKIESLKKKVKALEEELTERAGNEQQPKKKKRKREDGVSAAAWKRGKRRTTAGGIQVRQRSNRRREAFAAMELIHGDRPGMILGILDLVDHFGTELINEILKSKKVKKILDKKLNASFASYHRNGPEAAKTALITRLRQKMGRKKTQRIQEAASKVFNPETGKFEPRCVETVMGRFRFARSFATAPQTAALKQTIIAEGLLTHSMPWSREGDPAINQAIEDIKRATEIEMGEVNDCNGVRRPLGVLLRNTIQVIFNLPHLHKEVRWFLDDNGEKRVNHWMCATAGDGFPRTKHTGAMEQVLQILNLHALTNLVDWAMTIFGLDGSESGVHTEAYLRVLAREIEDLEKDGLMIATGEDGEEEHHTFKFVHKADQKYWHLALRMGGCSARFFSPFYNVCAENAKVIGATVGPAGSGATYECWEFDDLVAKAKDVMEKKAVWRREHPDWSDKKLHEKARDYAASMGHSMYNGVPFLRCATFGIPDPLHCDTNEMAAVVELMNKHAQEKDHRDSVGYSEEGSYQMRLWAAMRGMGLGLEADRLKNRQLVAEGKATPGAVKLDFRLTGTKSIDVMRRCSALLEVFDTRGDGSVTEPTPYELFFVRMMRLRCLYMRQLSTVYSQFWISMKDVEELRETGVEYLHLLCLFGLKVGPNEHAIGLGIPEMMKRLFPLFRVETDKAMGPGIIGSLQCVEKKHADTKNAMLYLTSGRKNTCWVEHLTNETIRLEYGELHVPQPMRYSPCSTNRIPERDTSEGAPPSCSLCSSTTASSMSADVEFLGREYHGVCSGCAGAVHLRDNVVLKRRLDVALDSALIAAREALQARRDAVEKALQDERREDEEATIGTTVQQPQQDEDEGEVDEETVIAANAAIEADIDRNEAADEADIDDISVGGVLRESVSANLEQEEQDEEHKDSDSADEMDIF